jgi:hypothetical protein
MNGWMGKCVSEWVSEWAVNSFNWLASDWGSDRRTFIHCFTNPLNRQLSHFLLSSLARSFYHLLTHLLSVVSPYTRLLIFSHQLTHRLTYSATHSVYDLSEPILNYFVIFHSRRRISSFIEIRSVISELKHADWHDLPFVEAERKLIIILASQSKSEISFIRVEGSVICLKFYYSYNKNNIPASQYVKHIKFSKIK